MKQIALFGGAFDPPHFGHVLCITNVLNSSIVDEVWCVPSGGARYDKESTVGIEHRLAMLRAMQETEFRGDPRLRIDTTQVDAPEDACATIDLFDSLKQRYPDCRFYFVIGSDNVEGLDHWKESERLLREMSFLVVPRGGHEGEVTADYLHYLDSEKSFLSNISSARVREMISMGSATPGILPVAVWDYIKRFRLYRARLP